MSDLRVYDLKFCPYCAAGYEWQEGWPSEGPCAGCRRAEAAEAENARLRREIHDTATWLSLWTEQGEDHPRAVSLRAALREDA